MNRPSQPVVVVMLPALLLVHNGQLFASRNLGVSRDFLAINISISIIALGAIALGNWRRIIRRPALGFYFGVVTALHFPFTQVAAGADVLQFALGSVSFIGAVAMIYFGVRMIILSFKRRPADRVGFAVVVKPPAEQA